MDKSSEVWIVRINGQEEIIPTFSKNPFKRKAFYADVERYIRGDVAYRSYSGDSFKEILGYAASLTKLAVAVKYGGVKIKNAYVVRYTKSVWFYADDGDEYKIKRSNGSNKENKGSNRNEALIRDIKNERRRLIKEKRHSDGILKTILRIPKDPYLKKLRALRSAVKAGDVELMPVHSANKTAKSALSI